MGDLVPALSIAAVQLSCLVAAQSSTVTAVGRVAVCAWDAPNQTPFATACLSPGPVALPAHLSATDPRGTGAFMDITEHCTSGLCSVRISEHTVTLGGSTFVISRTSEGCPTTSPGPHTLIVGLNNPSPLPVKGKVILVFSLLRNSYSPWGTVEIDVMNDGSLDYSYTLRSSAPASLTTRELPITIPRKATASIRYKAELNAYFPANYSTTTELTFAPQRSVLAASYGTSCGPVLRLDRAIVEHHEVALRVSGFPQHSPWFLGIADQQANAPIGSGTCKLLLVPILVLPIGMTSAAGEAHTVVVAPLPALGVHAQAFAIGASSIQSSQGLVMNVTF